MREEQREERVEPVLGETPDDFSECGRREMEPSPRGCIAFAQRSMRRARSRKTVCGQAHPHQTRPSSAVMKKRQKPRPLKTKKAIQMSWPRKVRPK